MGRLLTFALGVVMGVVLKWQYDEQLAPSDPGQNDQTAGGKRQATAPTDVQVISIQVEPPAASLPGVATNPTDPEH